MALIFGKLKAYLGAIVGFILLLVSVYLLGNKTAKNTAANKQNKDYIKTRERMDEVPNPTDADSAREWLRKRGK